MTTDLDFAVAAYTEDGVWTVTPLVLRGEPDLPTLVSALRRYPGEAGVLGMISVDEDFFILLRVIGGRARLLISDVTAATEWPLARQVVDELDIPLADDDDEQVPAGDLGIVADLGMSAMDLGALCDDVDLYPEEMLEEIAEALGTTTGSVGTLLARALDRLEKALLLSSDPES
jgi:putative tRNA adenosine deaminase-associated protein